MILLKKYYLYFYFYVFHVLVLDNHSTNEIVEKAKEITKTLETKVEEEEDVPLNDPFTGNEGSNSSLNPDTGERNPMSLYNFKLSGLISEPNASYISLTDASGDVMTITWSIYRKSKN